MPDALTLNINVHDGEVSGASTGGGGVGGRGLLGSVAQGIGMGGGFGGALAIGSIIAKGLEGSPMFQGMSKLMNVAVEQILRPIGDMFGTLIRPMAMSLLKMSVKWLEWMTTVDGKALMQILQGIGEILSGVMLLTFALIFKDIFNIMDIGKMGAENIIGGLSRIGIASMLMGEKTERASLALDKLAEFDATALTNKLISFGGSLDGLAGYFNDLASAAVAAKNALAGSTDTGSADSTIVNDQKNNILTTPSVSVTGGVHIPGTNIVLEGPMSVPVNKAFGAVTGVENTSQAWAQKANQLAEENQ